MLEFPCALPPPCSQHTSHLLKFVPPTPSQSTGSTITSTSGHRVKLLIACKRTPTLAATSHTRLAEASSSASPLATQQDDAECDIVPQVDDFETATFADENVVSAPMLSAPYNMSNMSKVPLTPPPSQKTDYINTGDRATSFATFHAASADSAFQLMDVDAQGKDVLLGDISDALATYTTLAGLSRPVMDKQVFKMPCSFGGRFRICIRCSDCASLRLHVL